jgi:rhamnosyltransferase subunit B
MKWEAPVHALRAELGLPPMTVPAQFGGQFAPEGNLALFSRVLAEPQSDWPANTSVCGFARYDGRLADAALARELEEWLDRGPAPVVFTLGSAVSLYERRFFDVAIEAVRRLGVRALLVTGQEPGECARAIASARMPAASIKVFRYMPYSLVFPRAAVNVHQGGIGTLGQALAAGRPQLVTPVALDQPDNARRAVRLGVARSLPLKKATPRRLAAALGELISNPHFAEKAAEVAEKLAAEEREARAVRLLGA